MSEPAAEMTAQIRRGLAACEFKPFFQPIVRLSDSRIIGFEALARWDHPERGLLAPAEFVLWAEANGLVCALDGTILEQAWAALETVLAALPPLNMTPMLSVNLSPENLRDEAIVARFRAQIAEGRGRRSRIQFEITETMLIDDTIAAGSILRELKAMGASIALDDFGTGYSSFVYLHRLPIDCLKIDRSFSEGIVESTRSHAIVSSIIGLARSMNLRTVAEGVEDPAVARELIALGCDFGQGQQFGEPAPASALEAMIRRSVDPM